MCKQLRARAAWLKIHYTFTSNIEKVIFTGRNLSILFSLGILCTIRRSAADDVPAATADVSTDWWTESAGVYTTVAAATTTATITSLQKIENSKFIKESRFYNLSRASLQAYNNTIVELANHSTRILFHFLGKKNVAAKPSRYNDNNILLIWFQFHSLIDFFKAGISFSLILVT